jgi:2-oxoglutarate dehydrogenase E1 component
LIQKRLLQKARRLRLNQLTHNVSQEALDAVHAQMLIRAYRVRGHLIADLDPLGLASRESHPELDITRYGFSDADMGREITVGGWLGYDKLTLGQILAILTESYCKTFAIELGHIQIAISVTGFKAA